MPLALAVGGGSRVGQTYVFEKNGTYLESRLSYFTAIQALDLTPGHRKATPQDLESAAGRPLSGAEAHRCFACHTTASTTNYTFDPQQLIPGVTCESCHGPGAKHVTAMRAGAEGGKEKLFNPGRLTSRGFRRFLRSLPPYLVGRKFEQGHRHLEFTLRALPAGKESLLGKGGRPHHVRRLP